MKLNYIRVHVIGAAVFAFGMAHGADVTDATPAQSAALHKTIETCGTCHGINGRSVSPTFPNLAAQTAPYIEAQLHAFTDQTRADPDAQAYMWGMASQLDDESDQRTSRLFFSAIRRFGRWQQYHAHRAGQTDICGRRAGTTDSGVRDLPRCSGPRQRTLSASRWSACTILAPATTGDSECVAHGAGHARSNQGSDKAANGSRGCISRVHLARYKGPKFRRARSSVVCATSLTLLRARRRLNSFRPLAKASGHRRFSRHGTGTCRS